MSFLGRLGLVSCSTTEHSHGIPENQVNIDSTAQPVTKTLFALQSSFDPRIVLFLRLSSGTTSYYAAYKGVRPDGLMEYVVTLTSQNIGVIKPCPLTHFDAAIHYVKTDVALFDSNIHGKLVDMKLPFNCIVLFLRTLSPVRTAVPDGKFAFISKDGNIAFKTNYKNAVWITLGKADVPPGFYFI